MFDMKFQNILFRGATEGFTEQVVGDVDEIVVQIVLRDVDWRLTTRCLTSGRKRVPPTCPFRHREESPDVPTASNNGWIPGCQSLNQPFFQP